MWDEDFLFRVIFLSLVNVWVIGLFLLMFWVCWGVLCLGEFWVVIGSIFCLILSVRLVLVLIGLGLGVLLWDFWLNSVGWWGFLVFLVVC